MNSLIFRIHAVSVVAPSFPDGTISKRSSSASPFVQVSCACLVNRYPTGQKQSTDTSSTSVPSSGPPVQATSSPLASASTPPIRGGTTTLGTCGAWAKITGAGATGGTGAAAGGTGWIGGCGFILFFFLDSATIGFTKRKSFLFQSFPKFSNLWSYQLDFSNLVSSVRMQYQ